MMKLFNFLINWNWKVTWQKPLYLHCQSIYGYQTWQDDKLLWWSNVYKGTRHLDHVALWDISNKCISNTSMPMATKLGRMVTYLKQLPCIKLLENLVLWFCQVTWQKKTYLHYFSGLTTKLGSLVAYLVALYLRGVAWLRDRLKIHLLLQCL